MNEHNYLGRRAEILAELFLQDLKPAMFLEVSTNDSNWDFFLGFRTTKNRFVNIAVEVKGTEEPLKDEFVFYASQNVVRQLTHSNLPFLLLIVDVKTSAYAWTWSAKTEVVIDPTIKGRGFVKCPLIKNSPEALEHLKAEIDAL